MVVAASCSHMQCLWVDRVFSVPPMPIRLNERGALVWYALVLDWRQAAG